MNTKNLGRVNPAYGDLAHRKSDMGRVTPQTDYQTLRTNDRALNQQLGVGSHDARTDLVNPKHTAGNPFQDCKRLVGQGLKPRQIALRMSAKGYPAATIKRAMRQASPACRNMSQKQFNQHWKQHVQPATRTQQAVRNQARLHKFKQQNGIPKNYANLNAMKQVGKVHAQQQKNAAKAQAKQDRRTIGNNRMDGVKANAIKSQAPKPTNNKVTNNQAANQNAKKAIAPKQQPKMNAAAARARMQATKQQQAQRQQHRRGMRR